MKTLSKLGLMILAMTLALSLGLTALAEGTADPVPETPAAGTAVDEIQAKANALNEAAMRKLTAGSKLIWTA